MRIFLMSMGLALGAAGLVSVKPAEAYDYKYCLYENNDILGDCYYATYAQCMAAASGRVAYCDINPDYAFAQQRQPQRKRH